MRNPAHLRTIVAGAVASLAATLVLPSALAQAPAAATPPPGFAPPPAAAPPSTTPPPGFAPPPATAPPGYAPAPYPYPYPPPYPQQPSRESEEALRDAVDAWEPGDPVPPGYRQTTGVRKGLVIAGSVTLGSLYFFNLLGAAAAHDSENGQFDPLYVPCIGPFVAIGTARSDSLGTFALVLDGVVQTGGLAMFVAGLVATQTRLVRDRSVATVLPVPYTPDSKTLGLGVVGSF